MIVLDASAIVEQLLDTLKGLQIQERCLSGDEGLHCPHLLDIEVVHVLRCYCQHGWLSAARALQAIEDLADFSLTRYAHHPFLYRIGTYGKISQPTTPPTWLSQNYLQLR